MQKKNQRTQDFDNYAQFTWWHLTKPCILKPHLYLRKWFGAMAEQLTAAIPTCCGFDSWTDKIFVWPRDCCVGLSVCVCGL